MYTFKAYRLRFVVEAKTPVLLNEHQGAAIRGAFYNALRSRFCLNPRAKSCHNCPIIDQCPVAYLVSTLDTESPRGRDIPRPYTIQPPLPGSGHRKIIEGGKVVYEYRPGEMINFGITFYDKALQLFPYLLLSVNEMGRRGLGRRYQAADGRWRQGRLELVTAWAENPLSGRRQEVLAVADRTVKVPEVPVTQQQVSAVPLPGSDIVIRFLTPTRLTYRFNGRKRRLRPADFQFKVFFQRLADRLDNLGRYFSADMPAWGDFRALLRAAEAVTIVENRLRWADVWSFSSRQKDFSPIGGLLGEIHLRADDWSPFWPWLIWGQFTHVGKDAVKGNGMYEISE